MYKFALNQLFSCFQYKPSSCFFAHYIFQWKLYKMLQKSNHPVTFENI